MSRDPRYQRLLNSPRWKNIRRAYLQQHPLCERCEREGFVRSAVDVHHKTPVEHARTPHEMERLAYNLDGNNLEALCIPCHIKVHQDMRTHTKEKVNENKERARRRFLEANNPNYVQPYGEKADDYLRNLEEQAKLEAIELPTD